MNAWETLVASALVGTNRQEPSIDLTHPALADYAAALPSQSPTQQILSATGLIAAYQSVGNSPAPATSPLLAPTTETDLPCCAPLTARHLSAILNESRYEPILPELLQLLAQAGQTVPPDYLPLLLDRGKRDKSLRSLILPILGTRGQLLVGQNPDWKYALGGALAKPIGTIIDSVDPAQLQEIWNTGTFEERLTALTRWRTIQPAEARQAIATSWKQDKADDRKAWVEVLQTGLSLDDEEFLEVALFDRSESVRLAAVHLLNQLPSKYRQRLTTLASQCLTIVENGNNCKIEINYPKNVNKEWQDAGVNNKKSVDNNRYMTIEEWQFFQVISAADLNNWSGKIDSVVEAAVTIFKHPRSLDRNKILLTSWVKAACYQKRQDWVEALLTRSRFILLEDDINQLLQSLPEQTSDFQSQFFTSILTADFFRADLARYLRIAMTHNRNWDKQISNLVVQQFHKYIQQLDPKQNYYYQQQNQINLLGQYLDVSILPDLHRMQSELSIEQFSYIPCIELLEFRRDMRSAFNTA